METKLLVLKLFLDTLGIDDSIETVDDRKRVQKAIYLGQLSGIDLGYRYGWYRMGPYCPALTRDYYALESELAAGALSPQGHALNAETVEKLKAIIPLLTAPMEGVDQEDWLELLASVHFLKKVSGLSNEEARSTLQQQKPHIADHFGVALDILAKSKLLN
jgi:uncharacterized protein YwgA